MAYENGAFYALSPELVASWLEIEPQAMDFTRLDIRDGAIHYRLYAQDGRFVPMTAIDTRDNRIFVSWLQRHDRYTAGRP